ncbi:hypothetical protein HG535_0C04430 [Zygotorulaspora mrakii]|uniref:Altered inheritance of mitochondria protein 13, mitochondrial n=1 Tax=Zygotorulaspora mrakii TaxID=42260 RepID=A0A7H9B275_ZYGMR|nr:uncharacterized protein HG535_0C04430 [Zygotorulaspora mrakii]QLG72089.1 hypothetical protein HG535_0C04430 [Zygotorulaspora mrakii]
MGSQPSKPGEITVFQPKTQIDFSETLLSQLESSKETNYTRKQLADRYIEQRVSDRLSELEEETLKKFESKLQNSLLQSDKTDESGVSSNLLNEKIEKLNKKLDSLQEMDKSRSSKFGEDPAKKNLRKCLLENKGKPLNCYVEIEKFKKLVMDQV